MRLLASVLRRQRRQLHPLFLRTSFSYSYHSSSHSLFRISIHCNHNCESNYATRCSIAPQNQLQLSRRFSTEVSTQGLDELILPVKAVISMLDTYHDVSGFPWWIIISSSTVAMRLALFPLVVLQLKKIRRIGELLPKLPPLFPPPLSGRSFKDQITLSFKEKKAAGCPSFFWFISAFTVQVPLFFLWLMSIRRMSLDNHPGFDSGGTLWFENLTEYPHGTLGIILPLIITGLHFTTIQISFQKSSLQDLPGTLGLFTKGYRMYLLLLTLPILFATFNVPQGSLVCWLTNSSVSLVQLLCLRNPNILEFLGLPKINGVILPTKKERDSSAVADTLFIRTKQGPISAETLSPAELVAYSIKILTAGHTDAAIRFLRLALQKDPGNVSAMVAMGQTLLQKEQFADAIECLERAISKLLETGFPTEVEDVDLLILSYQCAGIGNAKQGKTKDGIEHLERIAQMDEPEDSRSKARYYDGLLLLSSALLQVDRKDEAFKYLQKAAAFNPDYNVYFEHFETDPKDFTRNVGNSRREF